MREAVALLIAHEYRPVEGRDGPGLRIDARRGEVVGLGIGARELERMLPLHELQADIAAEHGERGNCRQARAIGDRRGDQAGDDDAGEPEIDDERRADRRTPV